jgi:hypothetical protein
MLNRDKAKVKSAEAPDAFCNQEPQYEAAQPMLSPPLEITRDMLRLLNVVDETIIVHDPR